MRIAIRLSLLLGLFILGCEGDNGNSAEYDSTLEIQVGCSDVPQVAADSGGQVYVAATCRVPVPSERGAGACACQW